MTRTHTILTLLAAGHLILIACGAAQVPLGAVGGVPGQAAQTYGGLTGADAGYGFFAPSVSAQLRATFVLQDQKGRTWTDTLTSDDNREVQLRIGSMLAHAAEPGRLQEAITVSWAAQLLGRHPTARAVLVRVEAYDLPTMAEYRAGKQPEWALMYEVTFTRAELARAAKEPQR